MSISTRGTTVLITGASSGLGVEFANEFARRGADLVIVARRRERLEELAERLRREHGTTVHVVPLDLAAPDAAATLRARTDELGVRIEHVVNNAGFGMQGEFADADPERIDEMVRLNIGALVAVTRAYLPDLVAAGTGTVVNIASTASYQPCPTMAVYGATKAFVLSFSEAIASEVHEHGVTVLAVSPGPTRTEFFEVATGRSESPGFMQTASQVVATAFRALDRARPPYSVISGLGNAVGALGARFLPRRAVIAVSARVLGRLPGAH
ncbi:SDR family oxidoreductase [Pseudoclavibacter chungangensis]|uniref:SDR family oxidoreductase n=1 Tax=Pseudoclavibacter chungangensis TaxID=587635 RepID=A0A7J5BNZ7_9MICO|nr:SDR family oxidoreductase [Pseudoclavibacter chungangensis]KAB1654322.1 SDR family oxidoreductase [Pseudoclavibacter chungangensis]NYJ65264.1 hypothetical protein [Pseudoclavibacter chungangensis]